MSKFYHAMEIWFVKMSTGGNPPFVAELAMRQVWSEAFLSIPKVKIITIFL
jgi:hypothetical protein